jgi:hypothetical protein
MKEFLKKYIGIILSTIMIALLVSGYFLQTNHPKLTHVFVDVIVTYLCLVYGLILFYLGLKFVTWYEKQCNKLIAWVRNKIIKK